MARTAERVAGARSAASAVVAELVGERRTRSAELSQCREGAVRLVLAAADAVELLEQTSAAVAAGLPSADREALRVAAHAAWQRLEAAGVERFGKVGEPVDRARHEVVKSLGRRRSGGGVVAEVVSPGVRFQGRQLRAAAVVASGDPR